MSTDDELRRALSASEGPQPPDDVLDRITAKVRARAGARRRRRIGAAALAAVVLAVGLGTVVRTGDGHRSAELEVVGPGTTRPAPTTSPTSPVAPPSSEPAPPSTTASTAPSTTTEPPPPPSFVDLVQVEQEGQGLFGYARLSLPAGAPVDPSAVLAVEQCNVVADGSLACDGGHPPADVSAASLAEPGVVLNLAWLVGDRPCGRSCVLRLAAGGEQRRTPLTFVDREQWPRATATGVPVDHGERLSVEGGAFPPGVGVHVVVCEAHADTGWGPCALPLDPGGSAVVAGPDGAWVTSVVVPPPGRTAAPVAGRPGDITPSRFAVGPVDCAANVCTLQVVGYSDVNGGFYELPVNVELHGY